MASTSARWFNQRQSHALLAESGFQRAVASEIQSAGLNAARLIQRTIAETEVWLDRIEQLATDGELNADSASRLIRSWRETIAAGREALGVDVQQPRVAISIKAPTTPEQWKQLAVERAGRPICPNDLAIPLRIERVERPALPPANEQENDSAAH